MTDTIDKKLKENAALARLAKNLTNLMKIHNTNESELARQLNITYNTIHRLVTGTTTDPKLSTLQQLADHFNLSLDSLLSKQLNLYPSPENHYRVPVISWDDAQVKHFFAQFNPEQWEKWIPVATNNKKLIDKHCYALESTRSMQPRFPLGTLFILKPNEVPMDGDLILVRFKDDQALSLRELIIDSPDWQLCPIIPGSKNLLLDRSKMEIIAVVVLTLIQTRHH